jgi:ribosomal-protein-alanine N-acetyltransferase
MTIRRAVARDVPALVALHAARFDIGWDRESFEVMVASDLVFVTGEPIVAMLVIRVACDEAEILTLATHANFARTGLAAKLLDYGAVHMAEAEITRVILEVARDNRPALALYKEAGFLQIGVRKSYYVRHHGPAVDALVLARAVDETALTSLKDDRHALD